MGGVGTRWKGAVGGRRDNCNILNNEDLILKIKKHHKPEEEEKRFCHIAFIFAVISLGKLNHLAAKTLLSLAPPTPLPVVREVTFASFDQTVSLCTLQE